MAGSKTMCGASISPHAARPRHRAAAAGADRPSPPHSVPPRRSRPPRPEGLSTCIKLTEGRGMSEAAQAGRSAIRSKPILK
eukprot:scaffold26763_cov44-Prasinocladus_malaysianus.AAC.2